MATEDLAVRIARLEAVDAIRGVMADYCHFYDVGWEGAGENADRVADLFLEDGVWDGGSAGRHVGRQDIRDTCAMLGRMAEMSVHIMMNPKIDVRGDEAEGSWNGFIPLAREGDAMWICGRYECQFRKVGEAWKIAHMRFFTAFQTPYHEGFARIRIMGEEDGAAERPAANA